MKHRVTRAEVIRFLVMTNGSISSPGKHGNEASVCGRSQTTAYVIPDAMLNTMIAENLVEVVGTRTMPWPQKEPA